MSSTATLYSKNLLLNCLNLVIRFKQPAQNKWAKLVSQLISIRSEVDSEAQQADKVDLAK